MFQRLQLRNVYIRFDLSSVELRSITTEFIQHYKSVWCIGLVSRFTANNMKALGPNKKISVFRVTDLKSLGRGRHTYFLGEKNINLCILKGIFPFKMHKIIYVCPENLKKSGFHQ